jgi:23S rRNA (guanine745-N1)-methyltransferase
MARSASASTSAAPLACTVRECAQPLERRDRVLVCPAGHSFDIARSGYVNLLQPQDRRSREAGDSSEAVDARASLLEAGVGRPLLTSIAARAVALGLGGSPVVADLGCGSGEALAALTEKGPFTAVGIDLSVAAIERASRRFPQLTWVVANADRRLPLLDGQVDLVVSIHARRNPVEAARVLAPTGYLLIAVPAPDDVIELRVLVQGRPLERDRSDAVLAEHQSQFQLMERFVVRETVELDREALLKLLRGTYRGVRRGVAQSVSALTQMKVTLASEVLVLRLR